MQKTQTLIRYKNNVIRRWDNYLYNPSKYIYIDGEEYIVKHQFDEIDDDEWLVRHIIVNKVNEK